MAKKNLLAANLKRPSLKRTMRVSEETMDEVVRKVSDNPPPKVEKVAKQPAPAPKAVSVPAAAPTPPPAPKAVATESSAPKKGRGSKRKAAGDKAVSPRSVHPAEGTKRLTLDIPHTLHKELKLLSIHQEISMKDYIISVVERSLKK
ncbi:hypothetical protein FUA23_07270 [Neolewinella aurantiaca]|uniref:Uncharacterized protein n=1 Tax=Neolewinella aurantiaca TaxID=2602767 RepID=A0A5C7FK72_9BACT|nr:hypothetical protein [Neolewinella aurantiaca]TXF90313.1 hypothetical protein FUA23_07270 [Neolewinella aurantiaca]